MPLIPVPAELHTQEYLDRFKKQQLSHQEAMSLVSAIAIHWYSALIEIAELRRAVSASPASVSRYTAYTQGVGYAKKVGIEFFDVFLHFRQAYTIFAMERTISEQKDQVTQLIFDALKEATSAQNFKIEFEDYLENFSPAPATSRLGKFSKRAAPEPECSTPPRAKRPTPSIFQGEGTALSFGNDDELCYSPFTDEGTPFRGLRDK